MLKGSSKVTSPAFRQKCLKSGARSILRSLLRKGLKNRPVVEDCGGIRFAGRGQLVEGLRLLPVAQAAVADAQLDTGEVAIAVWGDKTAPAVVPGTGQGQGVPVGCLPVLLPLEKPEADVAADLSPGPRSEEHTSELQSQR